MANNWSRVAGPWPALFPSELTPQGISINRADDGYIYDIAAAPNPNIDLANSYMRVFRYKEGSTEPEIVDSSLKVDTANIQFVAFTNIATIGNDSIFVIMGWYKSPVSYFFRFYRWNPTNGLTQWKTEISVVPSAIPINLYATRSGNLIFIWDMGSGGSIRQEAYDYPNPTPVVLGDISRPQNVSNFLYTFSELNSYLWWVHDNQGRAIYRTQEMVAGSLVSFGTGNSDTPFGAYALESTGRVYVTAGTTLGFANLYRVPTSGTTLEFVRAMTSQAGGKVLTDSLSGWAREGSQDWRRFFGEGASDYEPPTGDRPVMDTIRYQDGQGKSELLVAYAQPLTGGNAAGLWKLQFPLPPRGSFRSLTLVPKILDLVNIYRDPPVYDS